MAQDLQRLKASDFSKGYNDKNKPEDLTKGYLADILNAFIETNKIVKRAGSSAIGDAPVNKPILGQARHEPSGASKYILRARNTSDDANSVVEGWSGSGNFGVLTGASSQTANALHEFVTINNATYIFNSAGDTVLKTTNGTSTSTVAAIPKGKGGKWFHNFFFVFGVSGNTSRLYFSDVNTPETFDAVNGYVDVNPGDNEDITGLGVQKDQLLIFKPNRIWSLTGYGTTDFTLADLGEVFTGIGTLAQRSIVEAGNDTYYISFQGGIPHIRSVQRTQQGYLYDASILSDAITGTMGRIVTSRVDQTAGVFDGRRVWFSICTDGGTTNNEIIVMDTQTGAWVRLTGINASILHVSTISGVTKIYSGSSTANGKSYLLLDGVSDDGAAIDFQIKTPSYAPQPGYKCRFKYLYLTGDVSTDVDIDINYSPDGFTESDLGTISLTGTGAEFGSAIFDESRFGATSVAKQRLDFAGGNAYYMQYFMGNNTTDALTIRDWELFYKPKGLRAT